MLGIFGKITDQLSIFILSPFKQGKPIQLGSKSLQYVIHVVTFYQIDSYLYILKYANMLSAAVILPTNYEATCALKCAACKLAQ